MTHHVNCIPQNRRRSNYALRDHQEFEARVFPPTNPLNIPWSLGCVGCCHAYLLSREYSPHVNVFMADDVVFTFPIPGNTIDCFVSDSAAPNPAHGQLATNPVSGTVVGSALANGRNYIFYSMPGIPVQPAAISIGVEVTARLEAISVENLNANDIRVAKLNIVDATLLELYREKSGQSSLNGHVLLQPVPAILRAAAPEDNVNKTADSVSKLTVKGWM